MDKKKAKKGPLASRLRQPVGAVTWRKKANVSVKRTVSDGVKFFQPQIETGPNPACGYEQGREGFKVSSRSKALQHAFDYCNAHKMRVMKVSGVREDKFTLW